MIRSERGDIWKYEKSHLIVVPTNIGWKRTPDGDNIMGKGLALQAARRYLRLASWYGEKCREGQAETPVLLYTDGPIILFPVKPLNLAQPWLSWRSKADLKLIERSTKELAALKVDRQVAVSMVGCGAGGCEMSEVRPILDKYLSNDCFVLVLWDGEKD